MDELVIRERPLDHRGREAREAYVMSGATQLRISMAVMYHPRRTAQARELADQCSALEPALVADPDPTGVPSPLRTAKLAWAACRADCTHHMVLQDDAKPCTDFVARLRATVMRRPDCGISLYVNRNSPRNSYGARRAAATGARWYPASTYEYTPTLGFLLPTRWAAELADYLRTLPDEGRDDDEAVTLFCRERNVCVLAVIPNLLDHGDGVSVAGNNNHGARRSVAFVDHVDLHTGYWSAPEPAQSTHDAVEAGGIPPFVVEVHDSRCLIRFLRPNAGEPVEHLYGWSWFDWCELLGVAPDRVLDTWRSHMTRAELAALAVPGSGHHLPLGPALEFWAAGYLLGFDVAHRRGTCVPSTDPVFRATIDSWVACGLAPRDAACLDEPLRRVVSDLCQAGFAAGSTVSQRVPAGSTA